MRNLLRTPEAEQDLEEAVVFIARDKVSAAIRWLEETETLFALIVSQPAMGERYQSSQHGVVRRLSHGNYVIYHRLIDGDVEILRVLHGAREAKRLI